MNAWDILLALAVAAALALAVGKVRRDRRRGKLSCGGDCARCMHSCGGSGR